MRAHSHVQGKAAFAGQAARIVFGHWVVFIILNLVLLIIALVPCYWAGAGAACSRGLPLRWERQRWQRWGLPDRALARVAQIKSENKH